VLPPTEELQQNDETRDLFIQYSCRDAEATWFLRESLEQKLRAEQCVVTAEPRTCLPSCNSKERVLS